MLSYYKQSTSLTLAILLIFATFGCRHIDIKPSKLGGHDEAVRIIKRDTTLVFMPDKPRVAAHILYQRKDHHAYNHIYQNNPFKIDFAINPLMRNPTIIARVERNGVLQRQFVAKRAVVNVLSDKKNSWSPTRSKLSLAIPFLTEGENVVVTTSYEWMDIRWMPPIFLQDDGQIDDVNLSVDVPFGVTMRFKSAKDGTDYDFIPANLSQEKALWKQQDNLAGLGVRYFWKATSTDQSKSGAQSDRLQVFLAFDNPSKSDNTLKLDTWESVSKYLYGRIDRYDLPSNEIREFTIKETRDLFEADQKLDRVFAFLQNEIEKRPVSGAFQEQDVQPATRTFARKFGSGFDIAILGKAMFMSIGFDADIVAVGDKSVNPRVVDMFSPALYNSVILAVENNGSMIYFDPNSTRNYSEQLDLNLQGQHALLLRQKKGARFSLPFAVAQRNTKTLSYQLWLTNDGLLEGEYSIDLSGLETAGLRTLSRVQSQMASPTQVEDLLKKQEGLPFSLETAELYDDDLQNEGVRVFGQIKPAMLKRANDGAFEIDMASLLAPALATVKDAAKKGYSSITKISLFLMLSESSMIKNLPPTVNVSADGVSGRFSAYYDSGQLVIEGMAMVSFPLKHGVTDRLGREVEKLKWFVDHPLIIAESERISEVQHANQQPHTEENP